MLPPPLQWIEGFITSVVRATDSQVVYDCVPTVNPLVFRVKISFPERISGKNMLVIWNLFQMYAAKNNSVPQGKTSQGDKTLLADVAIKRRLGLPQATHPLE